MIPVQNECSPVAKYNKAHVSARNCIERCNGAPKARFRCIFSGNYHTLQKKSGTIIIACAVLHNICTEGRHEEDNMVVQEHNDNLQADATNAVRLEARRILIERWLIRNKPGDSEHPQKRCFQCPNCPETFASKWGREQHLKHHKIDVGCIGEECKKIFISSHDSAEHVTDDNRYTCTECRKAFKSRSQLTRHRKHVHGGGDGFKCKDCGKIYKRVEYLTAHVKGVHGQNPEGTCDYCGKCFATKEGMNRHRVISHTKEFRYRCDQCDRGFLGKIGLKTHQKTHTERHTCNICNKRFKRKWYLQQHLATHESDYAAKDYPCELCSKVCPSRGALYKHMKRHEAMKYVCELCGKALANSRNLAEHRRTHSGEKPYVCDTCGRGFVRRTTLCQHIVIHTKEKPHKCQECGKAFSQKGTLNIHLRKHSGERPYHCSFCDKRYISKGLLNFHLKNHQ